MNLTMTPVPVRVRCPIAHCRFEHTLSRARADGEHAVTLPDGTVLATPHPGTGTFGVDRAGAHLADGHSLAEWIAEVARLRAVLADPDSQVAAARELQQLALERARRAEAERDAALAEREALRGRVVRAAREDGGKAGPVGRQRTSPSALCPVCDRAFYLRLDGRIRLHNKPGRGQSCSGSGALIEQAARPEAVAVSA